MTSVDALSDGVRALLESASAFLPTMGLGVVGEDGPEHVVLTYVDVARASVSATCSCSNDDSQACPMHHPTDTTPRSKSDCACRSTTDPAAAVLVSLVGPVAIMPDGSRCSQLYRPIRGMIRVDLEVAH